MSQPLTGLKILDFSTLLPGPYATQILADMGAQVLRIEAHNRLDIVRILQPQVADGVSAAHATLNRNKQSLALDLKAPEAKDIVLKLLDEYDIIIEQFRPGIMQKFGLDYDSLKQQYPGLIYCSITGYGQTGPLKHKAGHDINYLALSGLASYSGKPETGPVLSGTQIADIAGGSHHAVMGILSAVIQRLQSGKGQHIDISMSDCALALNTLFAANYLAGSNTPGLGTELLNGAIFYDYFATKDNRYLSVGGLEPQFQQGMLQALGIQDCIDLTNDPTPKSQQAFKQKLSDTFASKTLAQWQQQLGDFDLCIEPVLTLEETCQQQHFIARAMFTEAKLQDGNTIKQLACPIKFSASNNRSQQRAGVSLGWDSKSVLSGLGYNEETIEMLIEQGITC